MAKVDGSIRIDTKINTKNAENGISKLTGAVKKLGGLLLTVFAVKKLVDFGKQAIELASDLQEVQNVVDTAFGSMAAEANAFAQTALKSFGLSELSAKKYSSTFMSMGKSMGLAAEDAKDMSLQLTGLVGDVASFYNLDGDTAYTKLKSVYTGETEALKDLGVVMTEANLKAFALEKGIKADYNAMSQAEKVSLRYQYVTEQLSLAQGDFARTSDGWANQTRILGESVKSLSAIIGEFLIKYLSPTVRVLNVLTEKALEFAQAAKQLFLVADANEGVADTATEAIKQQEGVADAVKETAKAIAGNFASFDEINAMSGKEADGEETSTTEKTEEAVSNAAKVESVSNQAMETVQKVYDTIKPLFSFLAEIFDDLKSAGGALYESVIKPLFSLLQSVVPPLFETIKKLYNDALKPIIQSLAGSLLPVVTRIIELAERLLTEAILPLVSVLVDKLSPVLKTVADFLGQFAGGVLTAIVDALEIIVDLWVSFTDALTQSASAGEAFAKVGDLIAEYIGKIVEWVKKAASKLVEVAKTILSTIGNFIKDNLPAIIETAKDILGAIIEGIITNSPALADAVFEIIQAILTFVVEYAPMLVQAAVDIILALIEYICEYAPKLLDAVLAIITTLIQLICDNLPLIVEAALQIIMALVQGIIEALPQLLTAVVAIIVSLVEFIAENLPTIIDAGIQVLMALINGIIQAIPQLIAAIPQVIMAIVNSLLSGDSISRIISAAFSIITSLASGLIQAIPKLLAAIPQIISSIWNAFTNTNWLELGGNILKGIGNGIKNAVTGVVDGVKSACKSIWGGIKSFFGINSPAKLTTEAGVYVAQGLGVGFEDEIDSVSDDMQKSLDGAINPDALAEALNTDGDIYTTTENAYTTLFGRLKALFTDFLSFVSNSTAAFVETISAGILKAENGLGRLAEVYEQMKGTRLGVTVQKIAAYSPSAAQVPSITNGNALPERLARVVEVLESIDEGIDDLKDKEDGEIVVQVVSQDGTVRRSKTISADKQNRIAGKTVVPVEV